MVNSIDINIDSKCTASCSHCCFSCSPNSTEALTDSEIYRILDFVESNKSIQHVSVTGGEPLLRYEITKEIIKRSHDAGKRVSLVSNGFWGTSIENAVKVSRELKECGLDVITVSYDDFHKEYISSQNISNVLWAVKQANIRVALNITVDKIHNSLRLVEELGENVFGVEIAIMPICRVGNSNGMIESNLYFQDNIADKMKCPVPAWEFAIHHDGFVYPCCSPTVFESELRVGNIRKQSLEEIDHNINVNGLLYILKKEGLRWFIDRLEMEMEDKKFVNTCEVCKHVFSDKKNITMLTPYILEYYENISL